MNDDPTMRSWADESIELVDRVRQGDQQAATELFNRYLQRLIGLARARIGRKLAHRVDPEDVVQSAYRSFFHRAQDGQFVLQRSGDLWRLLAAITIHKLCRTVARHQAGKRAVAKEQPLTGDSTLLGLAPEALSREPQPAEALALVEELEVVMQRLKPDWRRILQMRLDGHKVREIAETMKCSERRVRRCFEEVREILSERLDAAQAAGE